MPNYNYECQDCHHIFEVTASIKEMERGQIACEKCGSKNTKRLFDGFGFSHGTSSHDYSTDSCPTCPGGTCSLGD
jgi:putative FmdB family regulatory protein